MLYSVQFQTMRLAKAQERKPSEGERMTALQMLFSSDDDEEQSMPNVAEASGWTLGGNPTALDTLLTSSVDSLSTCEQDVYCASNAMMSIEPLNHSTVFADSTLSSDGISISSDDSDSLYLSDPPEPGPSVPAQFPVFGAEPYSHFIYFAVLKLPEGALQHHVSIFSSEDIIEDSINTTAGYHGHIFRPTILLTMPFKRMKVFFFFKKYSSSNFDFSNLKTFSRNNII